MKCRSEWHSPATLVRIKTSRGPGFCRLTSSITSGLLTSYRTAAFIGVSPYFALFLQSGLVAQSLPRDEQFANLGDTDGAVAEQMAGDRALRRIFREPERIVGRHPVINHHARQQQPARIAAHLVDASALPRQRNRAGNVIKQTGCAPRLGFVVGTPGYITGKADGAQ